MTPEFVIWDITTSPVLRFINEQLKQLADELRQRYEADTTVIIDYRFDLQCYCTTLAVRLPDNDKPYKLSVMLEAQVVNQSRRDTVSEWIAGFLCSVNDWLQQEGLQLPGDEVKLLEEGE
jgi:hypothetical protein